MFTRGEQARTQRAATLAQQQAHPIDALVAGALEDAIPEPEVYARPDRANGRGTSRL